MWIESIVTWGGSKTIVASWLENIDMYGDKEIITWMVWEHYNLGGSRLLLPEQSENVVTCKNQD